MTLPMTETMLAQEDHGHAAVTAGMELWTSASCDALVYVSATLKPV